MAKNKPSGKKLRLASLRKHTRWAPFWVVPKKAGKGKKIHPSFFTVKKRNWRRSSTKV